MVVVLWYMSAPYTETQYSSVPLYAIHLFNYILFYSIGYYYDKYDHYDHLGTFKKV